MLGNFPLGNFALGGWLLISNLVGIKFWQNGPGFEIGDLLRAQQVDYDKDHNPVGVYSIDAEVVEIRSGQKMVLEIVSGKEFLTNALKGQLEFVRLGNRLNTDRQGSVMIASQPAHVGVIDGIDEFSKWGTLAAYKGVFGKLDWINDANFGQLSGWGGYTTNFYLKGKIAGGSASALMTGTGYWFEKEGSGRLGNPATNKYIKFDVSTGIVELGSAVALSWAAVTGAGKPADNATVGADWGSNVTGRPTNLVALGDVPGYIQSTYIDSTEIKAPNITGNSILGGNIVASSGGTNTAGLTGEGSGDSAIRIWAGSTYANRASAPFRVTQGGEVITKLLTMYSSGGEIGLKLDSEGIDLWDSQGHVYLKAINSTLRIKGGANNDTPFEVFYGTIKIFGVGYDTVEANFIESPQIRSSVATGKAPFKVISTTEVTNLNVNKLQGKIAADFALANHGNHPSDFGNVGHQGYLSTNPDEWQEGPSVGACYLTINGVQRAVLVLN